MLHSQVWLHWHNRVCAHLRQGILGKKYPMRPSEKRLVAPGLANLPPGGSNTPLPPPLLLAATRTGVAAAAGTAGAAAALLLLLPLLLGTRRASRAARAAGVACVPASLEASFMSR